MTHRILMAGDPKPIDRTQMAADIKRVTLQTRDDLKQRISDAQVVGDASQARELQKLLKRSQKLIDDYGFDG